MMAQLAERAIDELVRRVAALESLKSAERYDVDFAKWTPRNAEPAAVGAHV